MIKRIKKGNRSDSPSFGLWFDKDEVEKQVMFHKSCKFLCDQSHRLFGIGYFWKSNTDSASFYWRYDPISERFIISVETFKNKFRYQADITSVTIGDVVKMSIDIGDEYYIFIVETSSSTVTKKISHSNNKRLSYPLGLKLSCDAPSDILISINNI